MEMNMVFGNTAIILTVVGILTFMVVIIVEMIKDIKWLKDIPTKLLALIVSFCVVAGAMLLYLEALEEAFVWWYLVAAFFAAFIVGHLSINGWDNLYDIWERFVTGSRKDGKR